MKKFKKGASVRFQLGTKDPNTGIDISKWQGRIIEVEDDEIVLIELDSVTLRSLPESYIIYCEEDGYGWGEYYWPTSELESAEPRDSTAEREAVYDEIAHRHRWAHLEEEGQRISKIVGDSDDHSLKAVQKWKKQLNTNLTFPFRAEVSEWSSHGRHVKIGDKVKVLGIDMIDDHYGILVDCKFRYSTLVLPLADLTVADVNAPQHDLVHLYAVWFANR